MRAARSPRPSRLTWNSIGPINQIRIVTSTRPIGRRSVGDMTRMDIAALAPAAYRALTALDSRAHEGDLPAGLLDLVKLRVSQVNGCAYCVDSHSHDLVKGGETPARVYA